MFMPSITRHNVIETLRSHLEHAPKDPGNIAPGLRGWLTPEGVAVCAECAGRIMQRGCSLPKNSSPVFGDPLWGCDIHE